MAMILGDRQEDRVFEFQSFASAYAFGGDGMSIDASLSDDDIGVSSKQRRKRRKTDSPGSTGSWKGRSGRVMDSQASRCTVPLQTSVSAQRTVTAEPKPLGVLAVSPRDDKGNESTIPVTKHPVVPVVPLKVQVQSLNLTPVPLVAPVPLVSNHPSFADITLHSSNMPTERGNKSPVIAVTPKEAKVKASTSFTAILALSDSDDSDTQRRKKRERVKKRKRSIRKQDRKKRHIAQQLRTARARKSHLVNSQFFAPPSPPPRSPSPLSPRAARYLLTLAKNTSLLPTAPFTKGTNKLFNVRSDDADRDGAADAEADAFHRGESSDLEDQDSADELFDPNSPVTVPGGDAVHDKGKGRDSDKSKSENSEHQMHVVSDVVDHVTANAGSESQRQPKSKWFMPPNWPHRVYAYTPDDTPVYMVPVPDRALLHRLVRAKQDRLLKEEAEAARFMQTQRQQPLPFYYLPQPPQHAPALGASHQSVPLPFPWHQHSTQQPWPVQNILHAHSDGNSRPLSTPASYDTERSRTEQYSSNSSIHLYNPNAYSLDRTSAASHGYYGGGEGELRRRSSYAEKQIPVAVYENTSPSTPFTRQSARKANGAYSQALSGSRPRRKERRAPFRPDIPHVDIPTYRPTARLRKSQVTSTLYQSDLSTATSTHGNTKASASRGVCDVLVTPNEPHGTPSRGGTVLHQNVFGPSGGVRAAELGPTALDILSSTASLLSSGVGLVSSTDTHDTAAGTATAAAIPVTDRGPSNSIPSQRMPLVPTVSVDKMVLELATAASLLVSSMPGVASKDGVINVNNVTTHPDLPGSILSTSLTLMNGSGSSQFNVTAPNSSQSEKIKKKRKRPTGYELKENPRLRIPFAFTNLSDRADTVKELVLLQEKTYWNLPDALYMEYYYYRGTPCKQARLRHPELQQYAIKLSMCSMYQSQSQPTDRIQRKCVACLAMRYSADRDAVEDGYSDSEVKPTFINQPHLQADKNPRIRRSQTLAAGERDAGHLTAPEREAAGMKRVVKQPRIENFYVGKDADNAVRDASLSDLNPLLPMAVDDAAFRFPRQRTVQRNGHVQRKNNNAFRMRAKVLGGGSGGGAIMNSLSPTDMSAGSHMAMRPVTADSQMPKPFDFANPMSTALVYQLPPLSLSPVVFGSSTSFSLSPLPQIPSAPSPSNDASGKNDMMLCPTVWGELTDTPRASSNEPVSIVV